MQELDDQQLIREFAHANSEAAFAALVTRYVNLVYSTALRFTRNSQAAGEISQAVFIILARKSTSLRSGTVLSGWLYQTTRLTAYNFVKHEIRRQQREQEAYVQSTLNEPESAKWTEMGPLLDEAMGKLGHIDRDAVVLRFFDNKSARETAAVLKISEAAAHKRVARALEKLRRFFAKRGVVSTTAIIAGAVSANSVHAAPAGLAGTISTVTLAKGAAASVSTLALVKGALKLMAWTNTKVAIMAGVVVLLAAGTATVSVKAVHDHEDSEWQLGEINQQLLLKPPFRAVILPTKSAERKNKLDGSFRMSDGRAVTINASAEDMLRWAYCPDQGAPGYGYWEFLPARIIVNTVLPTNRYDFLVSLPHGSREAFQRKIQRQFGLVGNFEMINTNALLLKTRFPDRLKPSRSKTSSIYQEVGWISATNISMDSLARALEGELAIPVINETALKHGFDFTISWNDYGHPKLEEALINQLGLDLVPTDMPIQMLVIEKAK